MLNEQSKFISFLKAPLFWNLNNQSLKIKSEKKIFSIQNLLRFFNFFLYLA